jgi:hypothetical protein
MTPETIEQYRAILTRRFPSVLVEPYGAVATDDEDRLLHVFCVPDADRAEFLRYTLGDEYELEVERRGIPVAGLLMHDVTSTREYYPTVYERWHLERPLAGAGGETAS